jgi:hypothetical protein
MLLKMNQGPGDHRCASSVHPSWSPGAAASKRGLLSRRFEQVQGGSACFVWHRSYIRVAPQHHECTSNSYCFLAVVMLEIFVDILEGGVGTCVAQQDLTSVRCCNACRVVVYSMTDQPVLDVVP